MRVERGISSELNCSLRHCAWVAYSKERWSSGLWRDRVLGGSRLSMVALGGRFYFGEALGGEFFSRWVRCVGALRLRVSNWKGLCWGFTTRQPWFLVGYLEAVGRLFGSSFNVVSPRDIVVPPQPLEIYACVPGHFVVWNRFFLPFSCAVDALRLSELIPCLLCFLRPW